MNGSTSVEVKVRAVRVPRLRGFYARKQWKREQVAQSLRKSRWTGRALVPDLGRISRGTCQQTLLLSIYFHTEGKPRDAEAKRWRAPEWTDNMLPEDFALEGGFTAQQMREEIQDAVLRGLIARKCGCKASEPCSADHYKLHLLRDRWPALPNSVKVPSDQADTESDGSEEEANTRGTVVSPVALTRGTPVRFTRGGRYELREASITAIQYQSCRPLEAVADDAGVLHVRDVLPVKVSVKVEGPIPKARPAGLDAAELAWCELLDPIFRKQWRRTLTGDSALLRLLEAERGEMPFPYLSVAVGERAKRKVSGAPVVWVSIVAEIRRAWDQNRGSTMQEKELRSRRELARLRSLLTDSDQGTREYAAERLKLLEEQMAGVS